jgi:hypothetical protein
MAEKPRNPIDAAFAQYLPDMDAVEQAGMPQPVTTTQVVPGQAAGRVIETFGITPPKKLDEKQQKVAQQANAKKIALGEPDALRDIAAAEYNGNELAEDPVIRDLYDLDFGSLVLKYGEEVARNRWRLIQESQDFSRTLDSSSRTAEQRAGDTALSLLSGGAATLGSIASFTAGGVSDEAGTRIAEGTQKLSELLKGFQSTSFQERRESRGRIDRQNMADSQRLYESEASVLSDTTDTAKLRRLGRDWVNAMGNILSDPAMIGDVVAEGIGSLGPSAATAKVGAKIAGSAAAKKATERGNAVIARYGDRIAPEVGQKIVAKGAEAAAARAASRVGIPTAVGVTEAGGTYTDTANEVLGMSEDDLMAGSTEYARMREEGMDHESARRAVAGDAALAAAAVQLPVAAVAGKFVERFEVAPTRVGSVRGGVQNVVGQTLEEGFQGGASELAKDVAIQSTVDADRDVGANVGQAVATGMVAGTGMAGVVQAPGVAVRGTQAAGRGVANAVSQRLANLERQADDASPVGSRATVTAAQDASENLAALTNAIAESTPTVQENTENTEASDFDPVALAQRVQSTLEMTGSELNEVPNTVRRMVTEEGEVAPEDWVGNRFQVLTAVLDAMESGQQSEEDVVAASLWLQDQAQAFEALRGVDLSIFPAGVQELANASQAALDSIMENPTFKAAIERAQSAEASQIGPVPTEITEENVNTPEVQEAIRRTALLAQSNPAGIDPKFASMILDQVSNGRVSLRENVVKRLRAAAALALESQVADEKKAALTQKVTSEVRAQPGGENAAIVKTKDIVRTEILREGRRNELQQFGLSKHMSLIVGALDKGDVQSAQIRLDNLRNFAIHMRNKLRAANESARLDPKLRGKERDIIYDTWTGTSWASPEYKQKIGIDPRSPGSRMLWQEAQIDAETVANTYNMLRTIYGDRLSGADLDTVVDTPVQTNEVVSNETPVREQQTPQPAPEEAVTPAQADRPEPQAARADVEKETRAPSPNRVEVDPENLIDEEDTGPEPVTEEAPAEPVVEEAAPEVVEPEITTTASDPIDQLGEIVAQLDALSDEELGDNAFGVKRAVKRMKRALDLAKVREYERLYDAQGILSDTAFDLSDLGLTDIGNRVETLSGDVLDLADAIINQPAEDTPNEETSQERAADQDEGQEASEEARNDEAGQDEDQDGDEADSDREGEEGTGTELTFENLPERLSNTYRFNTSRSLLMENEAPARGVLDLVQNFSQFRDQVGLLYEMTGERLKAMESLLLGPVAGIVKDMNARLTQPSKSFRKNSPLAVLRGEAVLKKSDGSVLDPTAMKEGRNLSLVDKETGKYDPRLLQAAALAALHWSMNSPTGENLDYEDIARIFGIEEHLVTPEMVAALQSGLRGHIAAESLARTIMDFWGAEANRTAPMSDTLGIAQSLAAELLTVMDGRLTTHSRLPLVEDKSPVLHIQASHESSAENVKILGPAKNFLADVFLPDREKTFYFDEVPAESRRTRTQKGNRFGRLGEKMRAAVSKHREIAFSRNTPFVNLMSALGQDFFMELIGHTPFNPEETNEVHALSLQGRNTQIQKSWEGVMAHNEMLEAHAAQNEKSPEEVKTHFNWYTVSNERIHAEGFNPQSNKTMREAFVSTVSTLDLNQERDMDLFWATVAQSADLAKTEKVTRKVAREKAENAIYDQYARSVIALQEWLETGELTPEGREALKAEIGSSGSPKLLHALLAVARMQKAFDDGTQGAFQHNLSLEADGKTDGPINAMMHFLRGPFTQKDLRNLAKGGFFPNVRGKTLNQHIAEDPDDLYQTAANFLHQNLAKLAAETQGTPAYGQLNALLRIMSNLGLDVEVAQEGIVIGRGALKNPLTITVYGSGQRGIAGKIANGIMDAIYEKLSEVARGETGSLDAETVKHLKALTTQRAFYSAKQKKWFMLPVVGRQGRERRAPFGDLSNPHKFSLSSANREMLVENIMALYMEPMSLAIGEVTGNSQATLELFQQASQVQSALMIERFRHAVKTRVEALKASGKLDPNGFLSEADYQAIYDELRPYGAIIEPVASDDNHLNLGNKASAPMQGVELFRNMDGEYAGDATLSQPSDAGVAAAPLLTISRGDARMMVNFFTSEALSDGDKLRTLPVFDGLEMPADGIETISEAINKAIGDAWLENPAMDVAESFANFLRVGKRGPLINMQELSDETSAKLIRALGKNDTFENSVQRLLRNIEDAAFEIQARKNVYKRIQWSGDHMASGESPYTHDGEVIEDDLLEGMNRLYQEELAKLKSERNARIDRPTIEAPSKAFQDAVAARGTVVRSGNVRAMRSADAVSMLRDEGVDDVVLRAAIAMNKLLPDFVFYFGTPPELMKIRAEKFPDRATAGPIDLGQADLINGVVYIANMAPETVLHEMLHTAVSKILLEHYNGVAGSDVRTRAVQNLETLMDQFLNTDFSNDPQNVKDAALLARLEIEKYLAQGGAMGKASAVAEFLSWTLTNQNLAETLKKTRTRSRLIPLVHAALKGLRRLLGLSETQKLDMFSNIAFNMGAMMQAEMADLDMRETVPGPGMVLDQVSGVPSVDAQEEARLLNLMRKFDEVVAAGIRARPASRRDVAEALVHDNADAATQLFQAYGFQMSPTQESAFRSIQAAFAAAMSMDPKALVRVQKIFTHVTKEIASNGDLDARKFNVMTGKYGFETDQLGRTNLMASFLALSQVNPEFRKVLSKIQLPRDREITSPLDGMDEFLSSLGEGMMNTIAHAISGENLSNKQTLTSLDRLTDILSRIEKDDRTQFEKQMYSVLGTGNEKVRGALTKVGERLTQFREDYDPAIHGQGNAQQLLRQSAGLIAGLVNEQQGAAVAEALTSAGNLSRRVPVPLLELMNDIIGITDENAGVLNMVNRAKYAVSAMRQDFRETLPRILTEQFSRKLTKEEWSQLHKGMGKTDIAALGEFFNVARIRQILSDNRALQKEIQSAMEDVGNLAPALYTEYLRKAEELAEFMVSGKIDPSNHNLLRNAEAIARMLGEDKKLQKQAVVSPEIIGAIDRLTSLYAIDKLDAETRATLKKLSEEEWEGMDFLTYYMTDLKRAEREKANTEMARLNGYKGYIPSEKREGALLIVAHDDQHKKLTSLGYVRLGDYKGSGQETGRKGYYFSTVAGNGAYHQGAMQTVQKSAFGVDPNTGRTLTGITAGRVADDKVKIIEARLRRMRAAGQTRTSGEALMPVYNGAGEVVAYERSMDPERIQSLDLNTQLGEMIGAWAGRQAEEQLAERFNRELVNEIKKVWDKGRGDRRAAEFVDLSDPDVTDPVITEAWKMIPPETKDYIRDTFGDDGFMVRRDMLNNAVGYRDPSVGELWKGGSRVHPKTQEAFVKTAEALMGRNAFKYLVTAEKAWQAGISVAKNTIVIRSVIVPMSNLGSNFLQLMTNGVGSRDIYKGMTSKLVEIDQHLANLNRIVEINAKIARHRNEPLQVRRLEAEKRSLEDSNKRMSIWPLIEAGEFSTISEGLTEADAAIGQGKWVEHIENVMERIPSQLGTVGRYAVISRDTALFKGMSRAVQYGDFLAKAVLYDHLTKREGLSHDNAMRKVTEEFVNYNLLPGRTRSYLESMGLTWFWAYKLRSIKIAHRHIRDNPLRALLTSVGAQALPDMPGVSIGSPLTDNAISVIAEGRADYSIGLEMLFHAPELNPWVSMVK